MSTVLDQPRLTPRSAVRYRSLTPKVSTPRPSRARWEAHTTGGLPATLPAHPRRGMRLHWIVIMSAAMVATLLLLVFIQIASVWITIAADDLHYGRPRTFQTDAFVGHESGKTPSHFVAMNLHGRAYILEISGGAASKTRMIVGPQLSGSQADLAPITLQFVPQTGNWKLQDMVVHFGEFEIRYHNQQETFVQTQG